MQRARDITGIPIQDTEAAEALAVLVASFNHDGALHGKGAIRVQNRLLRILCNRLRMLRDFAAHPEINNQEVKRAIFIAGTIRTGSTKTQRLFSASGDFNWLPLWKTLNFASYSGTPSIRDTDMYLADLYEGSPQAATTHEMGTHLPEEESILMTQGLLGSGVMGYADVSGYLRWLGTQDMTRAYQFLHDGLKYLQWQGLADPSKRWLLKCPFHCGMESILTAVFPDASIIMTHRPPAELIPSMCSMLAAYRAGHSNKTEIDSHALAAGFASSLERHIQFRALHPEVPILDIHYRDVTNHVGAVAKRVYEFLDIPLSADSLHRILSWDSGHPIHKHGMHGYSLADYQLTEKEIHHQCSHYLEFYETRNGFEHKQQ